MDNLEALQERALQYEVEITTKNEDGTTRELTYDELSPLVEAARKAAADSVKTETPSASGRASRATRATRAATEAELPAKKTKVPSANKSLLSALGLGEPSDSDYNLAAEHDYPVAITGAKAYRTKISIHCAMGGGERPAGSVMLLTDAHAANKLEYLEKL